MNRALRLTISLAFGLAPLSAPAQVRDIPPIPAGIGSGLTGNAATATAAPAPAALTLPPVATPTANAVLINPSPLASPTASATPTTRPPAAIKTGVSTPLSAKVPTPAGSVSPAAVPAIGPTSKTLGHDAPVIRGPDGMGMPDGGKIFDGAGTPRDPTAVAAEDRAAAHALRFERYVKGIMGRRAPDERELRALLESYLEERSIASHSTLAQTLEGRFLPAQQQVNPRYREFAPALRKLSAEHGVPVSRLEALIQENGLDQVLVLPREADLLIQALEQALTAEEVRAAAAHYPKTTQGETLRNLAESVIARSGKSIEEQSRAGAFLYVNFHGRRVGEATTGRDPDVSTADVVFYGLLQDGRWKIGVYRQNRRSGVGGSDASYETTLRDWLLAGGISEDDLAF